MGIMENTRKWSIVPDNARSIATIEGVFQCLHMCGFVKTNLPLLQPALMDDSSTSEQSEDSEEGKKQDKFANQNKKCLGMFDDGFGREVKQQVGDGGCRVARAHDAVAAHPKQGQLGGGSAAGPEQDQSALSRLRARVCDIRPVYLLIGADAHREVQVIENTYVEADSRKEPKMHVQEMLKVADIGMLKHRVAKKQWLFVEEPDRLQAAQARLGVRHQPQVGQHLHLPLAQARLPDQDQVRPTGPSVRSYTHYLCFELCISASAEPFNSVHPCTCL